VADSSVFRRTWGELTTDEFFEIATLRAEVFYVEQRIDEQEFDDADRAPSTRHLWIADQHGVAAYLRSTVDETPQLRDARHSFGRVIVRADRRGERLAQKLIDVVLETHTGEPMYLHAQSYVVRLYEKYGFVVDGDPYVEAGLPHTPMYRAA
jgi:ElaA protein